MLGRSAEIGLRRRRDLMPERHPRQGSRAAILAVCLLTGLAALGGGAPSGAAGSTPAAGLEVAPGVYLAAASDSPVPAARQPSLPAPHRFIVGGQPGRIARWPWQVSLGYLPASRTNDWKNHSCGGAPGAPPDVGAPPPRGAARADPEVQPA